MQKDELVDTADSLGSEHRLPEDASGLETAQEGGPWFGGSASRLEGFTFLDRNIHELYDHRAKHMEYSVYVVQ